MSFVLTDVQEAIQKTAQKLARDKMPVGHLRALRDARDPVGFSRERWREMAELGLAGMTIAEEYGGAGLGCAELGLVFEELGRTLAPSPLMSTLVLGAGAIALGGAEPLRRAELPAVCAGERLLAFAHEEGTRHARHRVATRAERTAGGWRLDGDKVLVLDGQVADAFVVVARSDGAVDAREGLALFLVPAGARGLAVTRSWLVDSRGAARLRLDGVEVPEANALAGGAALLDRLLDRATALLSAEMLGGVEAVFAQTLAYLKTRKQFGVLIGSFQALKHRAAQLFCERELLRSVVMEALRAVDAERADAPLLVSAAKARACDTFLLAANEAIQMHGGIGVTDELDLGFYLKRARVAELTFGDAAHHRDRFARLQGY
jgi:alkylation response protein AidB-like acyl-CoA dehydrogenase